jgi:acyl carrier protein
MNRDEVLTMVIRHVAEAAEGLNAVDVDPARSMQDHDLSSLDIVEVVTRSMRELQVTIPRSQLRKVGTIDELVDALHRAVAARKS